MAEISVAVGVGWAVSPIITLIINKAETYIENKFFKKAGIEDDVKKMKTILTEILSIMGKVEKQKIEDLNQARMVREIKDSVYDAEDIMDEFEYYLLEEKSKKEAMLTKNTVSRVASSSSHAIKQLIGGNNQFKKRVKEVNDSLDRAKVSALTLLELMKVTNSENLHAHEIENWRVTSSLISDEIIGRRKECQTLIDLLLRQPDVSSSQTLPTIIPIVGQGGIGKTTLARMVFNDSRLNGHFDQKIWLTVSDKFDLLRLTREMLKCVCVNYSTTDVCFDELQRKLETELELKKILLILDDVWYNKTDAERFSYKSEWLKFLAPLKKAKLGSKIVLTTRDPTVEHVLDTESSIPLDGLNENDRWSLFELCAFDGENQHKRQELEPIAKRIVNKLKGLALAIRVVGTQLRGNSNIEEWKRTLNDNPLDTSDIMKILHRSYEHLPEHPKRCFAYCSLFPKDYRLKPNRLVHMWIAQGFIHSEDRNKLEVGKSYFQTLLARSFFQVIKKGNKEYYVMHDLMSDLACYVSKGECYILDKDDPMRNLGSIRHLSVVTKDAIGILKNMQGLNKLRTLMLSRDAYMSMKDSSDFFIMLKRIRVLHIECEILNLCAIGRCKHLRYLSVRNPFDMIMVKSSLSKLYLLSALFIKKWRLMFPSEVMIPKFLYSTSRLISIKTLDMYVKLLPQPSLWKGGFASLCVRNKEMGHHLALLGNVADIKGVLEINGLENVTCEEEAITAKLSKKQYVFELHLSWENSSLEVESSKYHAVIEALSPNTNLKFLFISGYPGAVWPSWLESNFLSTVKFIKLYRCMGTKMLPSLGQLPLLQYLYISNLTAVRIIGLEFYGNGRFPSLELLEIEQLTSLEEWSYPCDSLVFPKLNELKIKDCFMLKLDNDFVAPQYLEISSFDRLECMSTLFQGDVSTFKRLTMLEVLCCHVLITLQGLHELASLRILHISNCKKLSYLPEMEFFYSLELFTITDCPGLRSFPKRGLPVSLQILSIGGDVHRDLREQIQSKKGRDWDKIAAISGCDFYSSIYQGEWVPSRILRSQFFFKEPISSFREEFQDFKIDKHVGVQHST